MLGNEAVDQGEQILRDRPLIGQDAAQRARLVGRPGIERGEQGVAVDEIVLERQEAE